MKHHHDSLYHYERDARSAQSLAYRRNVVSEREITPSTESKEPPTIEEIEEMDEIGDNDVKW
jgi:hypothetical protein